MSSLLHNIKINRTFEYQTVLTRVQFEGRLKLGQGFFFSAQLPVRLTEQVVSDGIIVLHRQVLGEITDASVEVTYVEVQSTYRISAKTFLKFDIRRLYTRILDVKWVQE